MRETFVPMELLEVVPKQRRSKAMTPMQTASMIRTAALRPADKKRSAEASIATASYNNDDTCQAFGTSVDPTLVSVNARVLDPPLLEYRGNQSIRANNGSWNMAKNQMVAGASVYHWIAVQVGRFMRRPDLERFINQMVSIGTTMG
jgi:eukaryotic translation initiation factor 2C